MTAAANGGRWALPDTLRGVAILLVIADHCGFSLPAVLDYFEVPAFFIVSGMLFKRVADGTKFLTSRLLKFGIPYVVYNLLFLLLFRHAIDAPHGWKAPLWALTVAVDSPLWFLKALFWTQFLWLPIFLRREPSIKVVAAVSIGAAAIAVACSLAVELPQWLVYSGLPQALIAMPLFGAGAIAVRVQRPAIPCAVVASAGVGLLIVAALVWHGGISFHIASMGNPWVFYPYALLVFGGFAALLRAFAAIPLLSTFGHCSLTVFCIHAFFVGLLRGLLPAAALFLAVAALSLLAALLLRRLHIPYL